MSQFTHSASHQAALLIKHLLFRLPVAMKVDEIPRVTFTEPELAHVGLGEAEAREQYGDVRLLRWPYHDNDRAQAERETRGHIKVVTDPKGLILGATIVGAAASEQISTWTLAINHGLNIRAFAELVVPYPTYSEIGKRAAVVLLHAQIDVIMGGTPPERAAASGVTVGTTMTQAETATATPDPGGKPAPARARLGLSGKLLMLTILFVMIAEVLIYVPSIANFRLNWLNDRLAAAHTAALVLDAAPSGMVPDTLARQILGSVGARSVAMKMGSQRRLLAASDMPQVVHHEIDMRDVPWHRAIVDAFGHAACATTPTRSAWSARRRAAAISSRSCWTRRRCGRRCCASRPTSCCCRC